MSNQLRDRECDLDLLQRVYREGRADDPVEEAETLRACWTAAARLDGGDAVDAANSRRLQTMYEGALEKSRTAWPVN